MNTRSTTMKSAVALAVISLMPMIASAQQAPVADGQWYFDAIRGRIQQLGHRNWICIVDAAYPVQTSPGIEMVIVPEDYQTVVKRVLDELAFQGHVRPVVYLDDELDSVPEADAKGIGQLRGDLRKALGERDIKRIPHAEIIEKLAAAGEKFQVLMLKTNLKLPYTSVFIELDCGYWSPEAEQRLRAAMAAPKP